MSIRDYSSTPSSNTAINGINIDEGCSPGNLNNAIRQIMADIAADLKTGEDIQEYSQKLTNIANNLTATVTQLNLLAEMEALSGSGSTLVTTGIQGEDGQLAVWSSFGNITGKDVTSTLNATSAIPTSSAVKGYVDNVLFGVGQEWKDVSASRSTGTTYTNNTGRTIVVSIDYGNDNSVPIQAKYPGGSWVNIGRTSGLAGGTCTFPVPPSHQYRVNGSTNINGWAELR